MLEFSERFDEDEPSAFGNSNFQQQQNQQMSLDELIRRRPSKIDFETAAVRLMFTRRFRGRTRFQMAVRFVITEVRCIQSNDEIKSIDFAFILKIRSRQGQGYTRPQKPASERRFSFYQGRTPRLKIQSRLEFDFN